MFLSNAEIKSFIKNYTILFVITVMLCVGISFISVNIIKDKVVENNQAIIGSILSKHPNLENNIVGIVTQGKSKDDISLGKEILKNIAMIKI
ncbi:hypothetical protein [Paraclostridium sp. AKS73]|uniref:hypothetical protein n=1 Tax=Paraclostridium sp. AKS73 TaxID=2876116 RepID=UPI0021DFD55F|nr:hypothetical protein [Paraclostridium sp. AKS73]MCU9815292.1 hypothetical protein [Paraclostridium sp. AKS73]